MKSDTFFITILIRIIDHNAHSVKKERKRIAYFFLSLNHRNNTMRNLEIEAEISRLAVVVATSQPTIRFNQH